MDSKKRGPAAGIFAGVLLVITALLLVPGESLLRAGEGTWIRGYGKSGPDGVADALALDDGKLVLVGSRAPARGDDSDIWVFMLDGDGGLVRERIYGGSSFESPSSIARTADGGYVIAGRSAPTPKGVSRGLLLRLDSEGGIRWSRTYGGEHEHRLTSVTETGKGEYVAAGFLSVSRRVQEAWVMKVDREGELLWSRSFGGRGVHTIVSVLPKDEGNTFLLGETFFPGVNDRDIILLEIDGEGSLVSHQVFGTSGNDLAGSLAATSDGGFALLGTSQSAKKMSRPQAREMELWLSVLDAGGKRIWDKLYSAPGEVKAESLQQTGDGGFVLTGTYRPPFKGGSACVLRLDGQGTIVSQNLYRGPGMSEVKVLLPRGGGDFVAASTTSYFQGGYETDALVMKIGGKGAVPEEWLVLDGPFRVEDRPLVGLEALRHEVEGERADVVAGESPSGTLSIFPPTQVLLSPRAGDTLFSGSSTYIDWETPVFSPPIIMAKLSYSFDGGKRWVEIKDFHGKAGPYLWVLPQVQGPVEQGLIKVELFDKSSWLFKLIYSERYFTVLPSTRWLRDSRKPAGGSRGPQ